MIEAVCVVRFRCTFSTCCLSSVLVENRNPFSLRGIVNEWQIEPPINARNVSEGRSGGVKCWACT